MADTDQTPEWVPWTLTLALNLILPLPLGLSFTGKGGYLGIGLAILVFWAAGLAVCRRSPTLGNILIDGGYVVGCSQVLAIPQVVAGFVALVIWEGVEARPGDMPVVMDGFVLTVITGGELLLAAVACGLVVRPLSRSGQAGGTERSSAPPTRTERSSPLEEFDGRRPPE